MFNRTIKTIVLSLLITAHVPAQAQPNLAIVFECIQNLVRQNPRSIIACASMAAATCGVRFRAQLRPLYDRLSQIDWHHTLQNIRLEYDGQNEKNRVTVGGIFKLFSGKLFGGEVSHISSKGGSTVSITCQQGDHIGGGNKNEILGLVEEPLD